MRVFVAGHCDSENLFDVVDPTAFSEAEFEAEVIKALHCAYPNYHCGVFRGSFHLDGDRRGADLALIHRNLSHWFVVEVELISHSLERHVLPQARCFRYGEPEHECVTSLCRAFPGIDRGRAESLIRWLPRSVVVVANRFDPTWLNALKALDVQLLVVSVFRGRSGRVGHEVAGKLEIRKESLGFATYSAIDKSLRLAKSAPIPLGDIQVEDPYGISAIWTVRETESALWITRKTGDPGFPHEEYVQVIRTIDGKITLRLPQRQSFTF